MNVFSGSISGNGTQNGAQTSIRDAPLAEVASPVAMTAEFQGGNGSAGLASSAAAESSRPGAAPKQNGASNGLSNGAGLFNGAGQNGASTIAGAVSAQQPSPQSQQEGTVWGQGAASVGPTRKDTIDANYEEALRLLDPFRYVSCAL